MNRNNVKRQEHRIKKKLLHVCFKNFVLLIIRYGVSKCYDSPIRGI